MNSRVIGATRGAHTRPNINPIIEQIELQQQPHLHWHPAYARNIGNQNTQMRGSKRMNKKICSIILTTAFHLLFAVVTCYIMPTPQLAGLSGLKWSASLPA